MEAIKTYIETMFTTLPQTEESFRLRNEILISMEEKYNALKSSGKSENEAIGTVISEFGNIDELAEETGLVKDESALQGKDVIIIELATAQEFLSEGKKTALKTAVGVFLIIMGVALMLGGIFIGHSIEELENDTLTAGSLAFGLSILLIFVAIGAGILTATWIKFSKYDFLQNDFQLPPHVKQYVINYRDNFLPKKVMYIVTGVALCILSSLAVIIPALTNDDYVLIGVSGLLVIVACGAFVLIISSVTEMSIQILLGTYAGNSVRVGVTYTGSLSESRKAERIIGALAAFYWPTVTAAYLLWSFLSGAWHISWIIWPIAALVFGAVSGAIGAFYDVDERKY